MSKNFVKSEKPKTDLKLSQETPTSISFWVLKRWYISEFNESVRSIVKYCILEMLSLYFVVVFNNVSSWFYLEEEDENYYHSDGKCLEYCYGKLYQALLYFIHGC